MVALSLPLAEIQRLTGYDITSDLEIVIGEKQTEMIEAQLENILAETPALSLSLSTLHEYVDALSGQYKSGIFLVVLIVIDILLEFILNRSMKKQSLIEQMRAME